MIEEEDRFVEKMIGKFVEKRDVWIGDLIQGIKSEVFNKIQGEVQRLKQEFMDYIQEEIRKSRVEWQGEISRLTNEFGRNKGSLAGEGGVVVGGVAGVGGVGVSQGEGHQHDPELRKRTIIIHGLLEARAPSRQERMEIEDLELQGILRDMRAQMAGNEVQVHRRIGPYNCNRKRPVLVQFTNEEAVDYILHHKHLLRGSENYYNVFIDKFMTKEEQIAHRASKQQYNSSHLRVATHPSANPPHANQLTRASQVTPFPNQPPLLISPAHPLTPLTPLESNSSHIPRTPSSPQPPKPVQPSSPQPPKPTQLSSPQPPNPIQTSSPQPQEPTQTSSPQHPKPTQPSPLLIPSPSM